MLGYFEIQSVSLWYSCSDSLNSFLDNTLIFQRCPILRGLLFTARKLWLALLFRKTCRRLFFGFLLNPKTIPAVPSTNSFVISDLFSRSQTHSKWTPICWILISEEPWGLLMVPALSQKLFSGIHQGSVTLYDLALVDAKKMHCHCV